MEPQAGEEISIYSPVKLYLFLYLFKQLISI